MAVVLALPFSANVIALALGARWRWAEARWVALVLLGATYVPAHVPALGVHLVLSLLFIVLMIAYVEIQILADRFVPILLATMEDAQRTQVIRVLGRTFARLAIALVFAILVPLLAAELAASPGFPVTSVTTALLLSAALVAIVLLIALYPTLERRAE